MATFLTPELCDLFLRVKRDEGLADWSARIVPDSAEGYCWFDIKMLDVGDDHPNQPHLLLHEVAHALTLDRTPPHNAEWFVTLGRLLSTYLENEPPDASDMMAVADWGNSPVWLPAGEVPTVPGWYWRPTTFNPDVQYSEGHHRHMPVRIEQWQLDNSNWQKLAARGALWSRDRLPDPPPHPGPPPRIWEPPTTETT